MTIRDDLMQAAYDRMSTVIRTLAKDYHANDPVHSVSGTEAGKMRRTGRQDEAARAISLLMGGPGTREHGEHLIATLNLT